MARKSPYSAELRRRAVAMVADVRSEYDTEFAAITSAARSGARLLDLAWTDFPTGIIGE